jgi:hypothetical protein
MIDRHGTAGAKSFFRDDENREERKAGPEAKRDQQLN